MSKSEFLASLDVEKYFDFLMRMLVREYTLLELTEEIWDNGQQDRELFLRMPADLKAAVQNLDTVSAQVYLNGVYGRMWDWELR
jgi:hypothetical protein